MFQALTYGRCFLFEHRYYTSFVLTQKCGNLKERGLAAAEAEFCTKKQYNFALFEVTLRSESICYETITSCPSK